MTLLTILGLMTIATGATLALFAVNPRSGGDDDEADDRPLDAAAAMRRAPTRDERGRQLVLRLDRRPEAAARRDRRRRAAPTSRAA